MSSCLPIERKTPVHSFSPTNGTLKKVCKITLYKCALAVRETAAEYCNNSSLHGVQYISKAGHYQKERWFWFLTFWISITAACYLIFQVCNDYINRPVETVFDSMPRKLHEIPFPAVTFCNNQATISEQKFRKYISDIYKKPPGASLNKNELTILAKVADMIEICQTELPESKRLKEYFQTYQAKPETVLNRVQTLAQESQHCKDYIRDCDWGNFHGSACVELFIPIVTERGYCCTFNAVPFSPNAQRGQITRVQETAVNQSTWNSLEIPPITFDDILSAGKQATPNFPRKQHLRGPDHGLTVDLSYDMNSSYCDLNIAAGSYVFINSQLDLPPARSTAVGFVTAGSWTRIKVQPDITLSDSYIKYHAKDKRNCYFDNEYKLQRYKYYTMTNCYEECKEQFIIQSCNCTIFMHNIRLPLCLSSNITCAFARMDEWETEDNIQKACNWCLPTCTQIEYYTDMSSESIDGTLISSMRIYMDVSVVYPKLRKETSTIIQLLSNAGGLLGLFMGFSVFSLLELLYYCTLCVRRSRDSSSSVI